MIVKAYISIVFSVISIVTSSQISGYLGKKNLMEMNTNVSYSIYSDWLKNSEMKSFNNYLHFGMNYERIVERRISVGSNLNFVESSFKYTNPLFTDSIENITYSSYGLEIYTKGYSSSFIAPLGFNALLGFGHYFIHSNKINSSSTNVFLVGLGWDNIYYDKIITSVGIKARLNGINTEKTNSKDYIESTKVNFMHIMQFSLSLGIGIIL